MNQTNLGQVPGILSGVLSPLAVVHPVAQPWRLGPNLDPRVPLKEDRELGLPRDLAGPPDRDDAYSALLFLSLDEKSLLDVDRVRADRRAADDLSGGEDIPGLPDFHEAAP